MPDYFAHFGLKPAFIIDESALRREYLRLQREWHPDFHQANPQKAEEALQKTALNNEAYKALQTMEGRVVYILREQGLWKEGVKHQLPQGFLADMLDLNDLIDEALAGDEQARKQAEQQIGDLENATIKEMLILAEEADLQQGDWTEDILNRILATYEKQRYLWRLRMNLTGKREL